MTRASRMCCASSVAPSAMVIALSISATALACPNCPCFDRPLATQVARADAAVIVTWLQGEDEDLERGLPGNTIYLIQNVLRDKSSRLHQDQQLRLDGFRKGTAGDQFLLLGAGDGPIKWNSPLPMSDGAVRYLRAAPALTSPAVEQLKYFLQHVDDADRVISQDAFTELAAARFEDVKAVAGSLSAERVRGWLSDPWCDPLRIGFYGVLLGIVGSEKDVAFLETRILEPVEFRSGADGLISGYLLLTGESGLDLIDRTKLRDTDVVVFEGFEKSSAMNALRFLWTYAPECISKERLRASMRLVLDYPPLVHVAIVDLARWQDWSVMDRLMEIYGTHSDFEYELRRAIIRYLLVAERAKDDEQAINAPEHARRAGKYLAQLRNDDPETVRAAERFFHTN